MQCVASFAEAWIEIIEYAGKWSCSCVASFAEAWIEIAQIKQAMDTGESLPSRKRGLKWINASRLKCPAWSLPSRKRGLKSHPMP